MKKESYLEECEEGKLYRIFTNSETQIVRVNDRDETSNKYIMKTNPF